MKTEIFDCQQCGFCCHGETTVSLDEHDRCRLADFLGRDYDQIEKEYLRKTGTVVQMKTTEGHCVFYDNGCTVHPGKPWRCTQWPLHPSILSDEANYLAIRESCPGINKKLSYAEFCKGLAEFLKGESRGQRNVK